MGEVVQRFQDQLHEELLNIEDANHRKQRIHELLRRRRPDKWADTLCMVELMDALTKGINDGRENLFEKGDKVVREFIPCKRASLYASYC